MSSTWTMALALPMLSASPMLSALPMLSASPMLPDGRRRPRSLQKPAPASRLCTDLQANRMPLTVLRCLFRALPGRRGTGRPGFFGRCPPAPEKRHDPWRDVRRARERRSRLTGDAAKRTDCPGADPWFPVQKRARDVRRRPCSKARASLDRRPLSNPGSTESTTSS